MSRDGRFLLNTAIESASPPIVVSVNWMKKLAPGFGLRAPTDKNEPRSPEGVHRQA